MRVVLDLLGATHSGSRTSIRLVFPIHREEQDRYLIRSLKPMQRKKMLAWRRRGVQCRMIRGRVLRA